MKAGAAVPVKFRLGGDRGLDVFRAGWPKLAVSSCTSGPADAIEQTVSTSGGSVVTYDPVTQTYTYVWRTQKSWASTCGVLTLAFRDGTSASALFKFTR
jgi:hypothetical protein